MEVFIDAMNVLGSRPDGWWRDRDAALRRLAAEVEPWAAAHAGPVTLVADGRAPEGLPEGRRGGLVVRYATRRGRDAADDRIVELVAEVGVGGVEVVTADRELRERVTALGATVVGPRTLLDGLARHP